jgi:hypothetical protein
MKRDVPIEDRLTAEGVRREIVRKQAAASASEKVKRSASPNISPVANRISRTGSITDRLSRYKELYDHNKENMKRKQSPNYSF